MTKTTDDSDIKALFDKVSEHFGEESEGSRAMFSMLVKTTLNYRDMLVASTGFPLTVDETRRALQVFMEILKTRKFPRVLDKRIKDLVVLWLEELKMHVHN